ncbi:MAG: hypothetical protein COA37_08520 [Hoeflea sp.]|uniref:DUF6356 family protein n=1 Tax=Hoeflea sp. TaxID=1940281 RepID=UPI000C108876|nr:DUF6356 family protein [Hoeflea sp.]PHR23360.1 MAG: hypothetical protein COA37_08520 [Hoeflea sp.]|tara:strand:+ start:9301 stop:9516 length:216 start_codon:yes stop_codon:yes gene_type:complete
MSNQIARLFTAHPHSVDESYFEHLLFAGKFAGKLFLAACAALMHAILPFTFEKTASGIINELHHRMHNRSK